MRSDASVAIGLVRLGKIGTWNTFPRTALITVALVFLLSCGEKASTPPKFSTVDVTGATWGKDFRLTDHNGQQRTLADFKGKAVVLFFGYVNCPNVCPMTMSKLASALNAMGSDAARVQVLLVTLDPKRDTPEILRQFVPAFNPTFLGLYGDEQATDMVAKEFKVFHQRQKPGANGFYTVDHSSGILVFDPLGRIRLFITDEQPVEVIARDIQTILKQTG